MPHAPCPMAHGPCAGPRDAPCTMPPGRPMPARRAVCEESVVHIARPPATRPPVRPYACAATRTVDVTGRPKVGTGPFGQGEKVDAISIYAAERERLVCHTHVHTCTQPARARTCAHAVDAKSVLPRRERLACTCTHTLTPHAIVEWGRAGTRGMARGSTLVWPGGAAGDHAREGTDQLPGTWYASICMCIHPYEFICIHHASGCTVCLHTPPLCI